MVHYLLYKSLQLNAKYFRNGIYVIFILFYIYDVSIFIS